MPRYFFHVIDGRSIIDNEGSELAGLKEARIKEIQLAGAILRDAGTAKSGTWMSPMPQGSLCSSSASQPRIKAPRLKMTTRSRSRLSPFSVGHVV